MIDKITLYNSDFIGQLLHENLALHNGSTENSIKCKYRLYNPKAKKKRYILVTLERERISTKLTIEGSIRKWHYGRNSYNDLNYHQYEEAIENLGLLLCGDKDILWGFKITSMELGLNVQLPIKFKGIVDSYVGYSNFQRISYQGETSAFKGTSYTMIVYDKGKEIIKSLKKEDRNIEPKGHKLLSKKATWIRFEMQAKYMSKIPNLSRLASTPGNVLTNWNELIDYLYEKIRNIDFDVYSSPIYTNQLKDRNLTELKEYLCHVGIKKLGLNTSLAFTNYLKRNKKEARNELHQINERFATEQVAEDYDKLRLKIGSSIRKLKNYQVGVL